MFLPSDLAENYEAENQPSIGNIDSDREINKPKSGGILLAVHTRLSFVYISLFSYW
jgi:hypothetical protein